MFLVVREVDLLLEYSHEEGIVSFPAPASSWARDARTDGRRQSGRSRGAVRAGVISEGRNSCPGKLANVLPLPPQDNPFGGPEGVVEVR